MDSSKEFERLKVSGYAWYKRHLNQHNVIHIMFNEAPRECRSYSSYIYRIEEGLMDDLRIEYPDVPIRERDAVWDALKKIYEYGNEDKFIFVLDEWDYIYHQDFVTEQDKGSFTRFLSNRIRPMWRWLI